MQTGTLSGWGRTGTAFDFQPTFGDNRCVAKASHQHYPASPTDIVLLPLRAVSRCSNLRPVNPPTDETTGIKAVSESSHLQGLYYIGTYEKRPGSPGDYQVPHPSYHQVGLSLSLSLR